MSTDRELLELAAKAAGYELHFATGGGGPPSSWIRTAREDRYWNPLTDDGDALRLAADLEMLVSFGLLSVITETNGHSLRGKLDRVVEVLEEKRKAESIYATVRRAIVRAAAEIGKAMP